VSRAVVPGLPGLGAGLACVLFGWVAASAPVLSQQASGQPPVRGDSDVLSAFRSCFPDQLLLPASNENRILKGVRQFDKAPDASQLNAFEPIPEGLRGVIRRVTIRDGRKLVALTIDLCEARGERTGYDGAIFGYLRKTGIPATVFVGGKWMRSHPARTQQLMADPRFELANHSEAHWNLRHLSGAALLEEIRAPQKAYELARESLGANRCVKDSPVLFGSVQRRMSLFRFPFGACNAAAQAAVADNGLLAVQWDVSTGDPDPNISVARMVRHVVASTRPGSIILAHGNGRGLRTATALPRIVSALKSRGFEFVTVSELLAAGRPEIVSRCYDMKPGDTDKYDRLFASRRRGP